MTQTGSAEWWRREFETIAGVRDRIEAERNALLRAVAPLMDREVVTPFFSAWEIDPHHNVGGEVFYADLRTAFEAVDEFDRREALQVDDE